MLQLRTQPFNCSHTPVYHIFVDSGFFDTSLAKFVRYLSGQTCTQTFARMQDLLTEKKELSNRCDLRNLFTQRFFEVLLTPFEQVNAADAMQSLVDGPLGSLL